MFELTKDGFYCNDWGYIEWENIADTSLISLNKTKLICLNTKSILNTSKLKQEINKSTFGYNIIISLSGTGFNIEEVYKIIQYNLSNN